MMRIFTLLFILVLMLPGCGTDIETISIERTGIFTFNVEGDNQTWRSNSFKFYPGQSVVKEFSGETDVTVLFRRYYLVFEGVSPKGDDFELSITLDIGDEVDMRHLYSTDYHQRNGGLHQISMILTKGRGNQTVYSMAELCADSANDAYFDIDRQNKEEKLIAGTLSANLCFEDSAEPQFRIFNAQFKDIEY